MPARLGGEGHRPHEHLSLLLIAFPRGQVGHHVGDREIERLNLLALHPPGAVRQDDEVKRASRDSAARHARGRRFRCHG